MNPKSHVANSLFARLLRALAGAVCHHPKWFVLPQFLLFGLCVYYTAFSSRHLVIDTDQDKLVGEDKKYHQVYMKYRTEFPGEDELAVVVESGDLERNRQFVERLAARLALETNLFTDVFYKGDFAALGPKALLFAPEKDLVEMREVLEHERPFLQKFSSATNLDSLFNLINQQFRTASREENAENDSLIKALPALERIITQADQSLSRSGRPVSPGISALFGAGDEAERAMYITFADGRICLLTARARSQEVSDEAVERMRQLIRETVFEVPGLNAGLTGQPVLDYDTMVQAKKDATLSTVVSLAACSLLFIYAYGQIGRPLKTVLCLIIGLGYSMAFTTLTIGHLNLLTVMFAPILIGLAIDYGIHLITRYEEETRHGRPLKDAVDKALVFTGQGIVTGALTTAGAFFAMGLTHFKGIQEMGIISGGGMMLCLIPMLTLLPVLLMRGTRQNALDAQCVAQESKRRRLEALWLRRPVWVVIGTLALCGAALTQFHKVYFDYNLLNMQSKGLASVAYARKLLYSTNSMTVLSTNADGSVTREVKLRDYGQSVLFAGVVADTLQQAREFEEIAEKLPSVAAADRNDREKSEPIYQILTEDQSPKLRMVHEIKGLIANVKFARPDPLPVDLNGLGSTLYYTMGYMAAAHDDEDTRKAHPELAAQFQSLYDAIGALRVKMFSGEPEIASQLFIYQQALFDDIRSTFAVLQEQDDTLGLRPQDLPPSLRNRFIGRTGKYRVLVFPKKDIWQRDNQAEFIRQLRSVLPEDRVTDTPVQLYEYETLLKDSYQNAALLALGAIAIMVFFHFRSVSCVILALLPVAIGTTWLVGLMGKTGIPFNPADIMTLPLVIGIGVTNGIQVLNRFAEEQDPGVLARSTGKAVLVSGLASMAGFGSLMLGRHQGLQSLGVLMTIGIGTCMVAGLTFLPALLNILVKRGWSLQRRSPGGDKARSLPDAKEPGKNPIKV